MTAGRALVTGDAGFIGRHMRAGLEDRGWHVIGVDPKRNSPATGRHDCRTIFQHYGRGRDPAFDLVVHCAAVIGSIADRHRDPLALAENLELDSAMFRWAARGNAKRVVYFSSCAAYPAALQVEGRVGHERDLFDPASDRIHMPDGIYGWGKVSGEFLAMLTRDAGVPVHVLRPFSGYGSDQSLDYPFPSMIDRALRREDPFDVWGDGTAVRDFVHVDDVVATVLAAVDRDHPGPLNMGWGRPTSMAHLAELIAYSAGYIPKFRFLADRPAGPSWRVADTTRSHALHRPTVTLEEGIARALRERATVDHDQRKVQGV